MRQPRMRPVPLGQIPSNKRLNVRSHPQAPGVTFHFVSASVRILSVAASTPCPDDPSPEIGQQGARPPADRISRHCTRGHRCLPSASCPLVCGAAGWCSGALAGEKRPRGGGAFRRRAALGSGHPPVVAPSSHSSVRRRGPGAESSFAVSAGARPRWPPLTRISHPPRSRLRRSGAARSSPRAAPVGSAPAPRSCPTLRTAWPQPTPQTAVRTFCPLVGSIVLPTSWCSSGSCSWSLRRHHPGLLPRLA